MRTIGDDHPDHGADGGADDVFDGPSAWRRKAVRHLGLVGTDAIAGANTGAGYPDALEPAVRHFGSQVDVLVDVGAGLGATTAWLARRCGADVAIAIEPSRDASRSIRSLFPELIAVVADAHAVPLRPVRPTAVSLLGIVSLVPDLDAVVEEATRVAGRGGRIVIADLCAASVDVGRDDDGPNTFWSVGHLADTLRRFGWEIGETVTQPADQRTEWSEVSDRVDDEIVGRHRDSEGFDAWRDDRERLARLIEDDRLLVGTVTATLS